jgi:RND family efflux transporter MFP subunit
VTVDAYPQDTFTGVVDALAPSVDPRDRTVRARATVADPQLKLKAGMFAQAAVATGTHEGVLVVPVEAAVTQGDSSFVWVVVDGRAKRQTVKLGLRDMQQAEVLEGLYDGAEVILSPPPLAEGELVLVQ